MSQATHRWPESGAPRAAPPVPAEPVSTPLPPDDAQLTLVSDHAPVLPPVGAPVAFPGYEIVGELGRGGMGVVYKARQRNLNRLVALKVILGGPLASDEDKARFRVEAEAAARLHHPNIVQVYDVGEHAGFSFMALELIEGETLRQWQGGRATDPRHAAELVSAVARAIQHAHEQGIVHRDIKPANILLAPAAPTPTDPHAPALPSAPTVPVRGAGANSGSVVAPFVRVPKVTDFGLAKALVGGTDLTCTGVACGTPNYMAPEQVRGKPPAPGVDVYGLGALLFELLAGRAPFVGSDTADVMNQIVRAEAANVRKVVPKVPRDLAVIVAKCLEKDPARRYATARDLADDLHRFVTGKPIAARPVGVAERAWRWARRNPVVAAFLFISSIGCLLTGSLAVALAHSWTQERAARGSADGARTEAEAARDELSRTLAAAQSAQQIAEKESREAQAAREAAGREARRAVEQKEAADAARRKSEADLRITGAVIRDAIRELARDPKFADQEFRGTRDMLLRSGRAFRDSVRAGNADTVEWLEMLSDVSHWLGYLEFRNDNHLGAATEYRAAADAAGRWAKLVPATVEARSRQSDSLLGAGNALFNAGRYDESEGAYRTAAELIDVVVLDRARAADRGAEVADRRRALEIHERFAGLLQLRGKASEREHFARRALEHARGLARAGGEEAQYLRAVQLAHQGYGRALGGCQRWDEGECQFALALELADGHAPAGPKVARYVPERVAAQLALAEYQHARGHPDRADITFRGAVGALERAVAAEPAGSADDQLGTDLAGACTRYAEFLRARRRFEDASKRYDQAVEAAAAVLRRAPGFRPASEASAGARVGRAHLLNGTGKHREAAAEWSRLAGDDPHPWQRVSHELFVLQSLLYAGDWRAATRGARAAMRKPQPGWMLVDLGRVWCLAAKQIEADPAPAPQERATATKDALANAVACLEAARAAGEFENPVRLAWYNGAAEFAPVRDRFDPKKK